MSKQVLWGISALSHDASLSVVVQEDGRHDRLVYASHAERYSRRKNESQIHPTQLKEAVEIAGQPDHVFWYERPMLKRLRYLSSGAYAEAFSFKNSPKRHLKSLGVTLDPTFGSHHESHAASVYYTRPLRWSGPVDVLVADAIGEFDTLTLWHCRDDKMERRTTQSYPRSIGLFYTAVTQYVGLKPNEEEYILMGMAAYGRFVPGIYEMFTRMVHEGANFHRGLLAAGADEGMLNDVTSEDLARCAQYVIEDALVSLVSKFQKGTGARYLCLSGGVALNCVANTVLARLSGYEDIWILPNPGDAGSSLGAILQHTRSHVEFRTPFLGTHIQEHARNHSIADHLVKYKIAGVARGAAEWGPRALGNRSLLADPRALANKSLVNTIKKRQKFRPFAPAVLAERASDYFELPKVRNLEYMQYAVKCLRPDLIPAVAHVDGTSRVQLVGINHPLRNVLELWQARTGCPVLLNTSLNVKGEPLVNTRAHADSFEHKNKIKVFT